MNFRLLAAILFVSMFIAGLYVVGNTLETSPYPIFFFVLAAIGITFYTVYKYQTQMSEDALVIINFMSFVSSGIWAIILFVMDNDYSINPNNILTHRFLVYILLIVSALHFFYLIYVRCQKSIALHKSKNNL